MGLPSTRVIGTGTRDYKRNSVRVCGSMSGIEASVSATTDCLIIQPCWGTHHDSKGLDRVVHINDSLLEPTLEPSGPESAPHQSDGPVVQQLVGAGGAAQMIAHNAVLGAATTQG